MSRDQVQRARRAAEDPERERITALLDDPSAAAEIDAWRAARFAAKEAARPAEEAAAVERERLRLEDKKMRRAAANGGRR